MKNGIELITEERQRHIEVEGFDTQHDDDHGCGELAIAAARYAEYDTFNPRPSAVTELGYWPWADEWWKPSSDPIRNLVKAGALIAAEIDRIQRATGFELADGDEKE